MQYMFGGFSTFTMPLRENFISHMNSYRGEAISQQFDRRTAVVARVFIASQPSSANVDFPGTPRAWHSPGTLQLCSYTCGTFVLCRSSANPLRNLYQPPTPGG